MQCNLHSLPVPNDFCYPLRTKETKKNQRKKMTDQKENSVSIISTRKTHLPISAGLWQWIIMVLIIAITFTIVFGGLFCLQRLPDNSVRPLTGSFIYLLGSIILCIFYWNHQRKEKIGLSEAINKNSHKIDYKAIGQEALSDKILKWIVTILAVIFALLNIAAVHVSVYGLPDKIIRPLPGVIYIFSGFIVISILAYRLWKENHWSKIEKTFTQEADLNRTSIIKTQLTISACILHGISTLSLVAVSFLGIVASMICLFSLSDHSTRPLVGAFFYILAALIPCSYFLLYYKMEKVLLYRSVNEAESETDHKIIVKEYLSKKIIKWIMSFFTLLLAFFSFVPAIMCIFHGLPDNSIRPDGAVLYLFSGFIAVSVLIFRIWKE